jgi:DNA-binding transcriptional ArsR family regulator
MSNVASLAAIAALIGEPARTAMLISLMDGRALTAGELSANAGVTPPTASGHLGQMLEAGLLAIERQGRHRYYRLSGPAVAATLESLMSLDGALRTKKIATGPRDKALRRARLCYDHLAGEIAVAITDSMVARGQLDFAQDGAALTAQGLALLADLGVDLPAGIPHGKPTTFCRPCLDWSERRPHIAGVVGRQLYLTLVRNDWLRPPATGRAVSITPRGSAELNRHFGVARSVD